VGVLAGEGEAQGSMADCSLDSGDPGRNRNLVALVVLVVLEVLEVLENMAQGHRLEMEQG
jgi:hypothetical protein